MTVKKTISLLKQKILLTIGALNLRNHGTTSQGHQFSMDTIQAVWNKGKVIEGYNSSDIRQDICGAWIRRTEHGNISSENGWEIDFQLPTSLIS